MSAFDVESNERRERDAMIARVEIPAPTLDTLAKLEAAGVRCFGLGETVRADLPAGWRAEADPLDHRRWHLVDGHGVQRFACFWKGAQPFGAEPGRGSIAAVEDDGLRRLWDGRGSETYLRERKIVLRLSCSRCDKREGIAVTFDARLVDESPGRAADMQARYEREFRARHVCA